MENAEVYTKNSFSFFPFRYDAALGASSYWHTEHAEMARRVEVSDSTAQKLEVLYTHTHTNALAQEAL